MGDTEDAYYHYSGAYPAAMIGLRSYMVKCACRNCGMRDFYSLPYKSEFMPFLNSDDSESGSREHSYVIVNGLEDDEEKHTERDLNCHNCGLPFLDLDFWDANEAKKTRINHG